MVDDGEAAPEDASTYSSGHGMVDDGEAADLSTDSSVHSMADAGEAVDERDDSGVPDFASEASNIDIEIIQEEDLQMQNENEIKQNNKWWELREEPALCVKCRKVIRRIRAHKC
jgi:hypothetical protein